VGVVAAGVHRTGLGAKPLACGFVVAVGRLLARQPVDVDAQTDGRPLALFYDRNRARPSPLERVENVGVRPRLAGPIHPVPEILVVGHREPVLGQRVATDEQLVDADPFEFGDDPGRRPKLPPPGFGMAVELPAQLD